MKRGGFSAGSLMWSLSPQAPRMSGCQLKGWPWAHYFFSSCSNRVARSRYSVAIRISLARVSAPMSSATLKQ